MAVTDIQLARELLELIAALDRRVPRVERAGEASIASDAAALRTKALRRLTELTDRAATGGFAKGDRRSQWAHGE